MEKMEIAKGRMALKHPFFATPVLSTPLVKSTSIPTAGTDSVKIYWNPKWFEGLDVDNFQFVFAHEVLHILFKHRLRCGTRNPKLWNIACDLKINRILIKAGCGKPPQGIKAGHYDNEGRFDGMSEEQIYEIIKKEDEEKRGGQGEPGDSYGSDPMDGDILPLPDDITPDQVEVLKRSIDQKLAQAANLARLAGKLPGEIEKIIDELLNPKVAWEDLLRDYMTRIAHDDESWSRRNRRFWDVYMPARYNTRMAGMTIIGDTSGSIGPEDYKQIATNIKAIIEDVNPEIIRVLWADTRTASVQMMEPGDFRGPSTLKPKGGGGTDMRVPLKDAEDYDPPVVVLITDGYTPWPDSEPPFPLIVVCTTNADCPVGEVVRIN